MNDPIKKIQRETQRYWYVDGLNEIGAGVLIFLLGLLYLFEWLLSPTDLGGMLTGIGQPMLIIGGWFVVNWAVRQLKVRITYPRTGYLAYRREKGKRRLSAILMAFGLAAAFAVAAVTLGRNVGERIMPLLIGLMMAGAVFYLGYFFELRRFYLVAVTALILGTTGAWLSLPESIALAVFFGGFGIAWIVSGAVTLSDYLRRTRPATEEEV